MNPFKSAFMPPAYTAFLYPFFLIHNDISRTIIILLIQIILSAINVLILYFITRKLFSAKAGIVAAFIYALLPEFIYASTNFNIVVLYHTGILGLFYLLVKGKLFSDYKKLAAFIVISIFLIYLRFEFILFIFLLTIIFFRKFGVKNVGIIYISILIALSPWIIRNQIVFRHFPMLSTSTGLNLYRGNNEYFVGCWGDDALFAKLKSYQNSPNYEIEANRIYSNSAMNFIINNPAKEIRYSAQKLYNLWVFNDDDKRTESLFYRMPLMLILFLFLIGIFRSFSINKFRYFYLFFLYFSLISVIFFALPRYQTMLKVMIIPFAAQGVIIVFSYLKAKFIV
jgi:4-amino-4-deoxy-L-arabinose transferase-like glycosyltransferase